jgi:hypothetical protein
VNVIVTQAVRDASMVFEVWLTSDRLGKRDIGSFDKGELVFSEIREGTPVERTLRLSQQLMEELRRGLGEHGPLSADNLTSVQDVIKVRDRLLTLVETLATRQSECIQS